LISSANGKNEIVRKIIAAVIFIPGIRINKAQK